MKISEQRILGLDPGFGRTGYALISGNKDKPIIDSFGLIETYPSSSQSERLTEIISKINVLIKEFKPTLVALEKVFFAANTKTALQVGEARGALLVAIEQHHLPIVEYTPPQVKLSVTGDGKADKKQIQKMLQIIFKQSEVIKSDDAADAVAIALCALNHAHLSRF